MTDGNQDRCAFSPPFPRARTTASQLLNGDRQEQGKEGPGQAKKPLLPALWALSNEDNNSYLTTYTDLNSEWITGLTVKPNVYFLENTEAYIVMTSKAQVTKKSKLDSSKCKTFVFQRIP